MKQIGVYKDIFKVDATISQSASFKERYERRINQEIQDWQTRNRNEGTIVFGKEGGKAAAVIQKEQVKAAELIIVKTLCSEQDVDQYINILSNKLKRIIKANKEIEFIE